MDYYIANELYNDLVQTAEKATKVQTRLDVDHWNKISQALQNKTKLDVLTKLKATGLWEVPI
jgi:hypothetical protein